MNSLAESTDDVEKTREYLVELAETFDVDGDAEDRLNAWEAAYSVDPTWLVTAIRSGELLVARGRYGEALERLRRSWHAMEPDDPERIDVARNLLACLPPGEDLLALELLREIERRDGLGQGVGEQIADLLRRRRTGAGWWSY